MPGNKQRRHPRYAAQAAAWVSWTDEKGRIRHVPGKCLDISMSGARLEAPVSIRVGRTIRIGIPKIPLEVTAVVRRADVKGGLGVLGVEFLSRHEKP